MKHSKILFFSVFALGIFGLMMIYSASSIWADFKFQDSFHYVKYQGVFFLLGVILMILFSKIPVSFYLKHVNLILFLSILLLILVLIPGIGSVRNGSRSWFGIGSLGIQPSEAAKISLLLFTSKYLSSNGEYLSRFWKGLVPILAITLLIFGLIMLQPDLGTGFILLCSIVSLLFIAGASMRFFIGGGVVGVLGIIFLIVIAPYRMKRITSFLDPWKDELGTGFQIIQSLYAIGPGGLLGTGYLHSIQKQFYLPEPQTDFIFSIITEEFGVFGAIVVASLFGLLFYAGIQISLRAKDSFSKYLSFGILFQLLFQTLLNLMVVVGMIPVTGVTLPFLSYGGSSLLVSMASIGIVLNISKNE